MFQIEDPKQLNLIEYIKNAKKGINGAHDMNHLLRVTNVAIKICNKEGGDLNFVIPMALLHDLVRPDNKIIGTHIEKTVRKARNILQKSGYKKKDISYILKGISFHSIHGLKGFTQTNELNYKILFDADKIEGTGHIGIARWFMVMGASNVEIEKAASDYLKTVKSLKTKNEKLLYTKSGIKLMIKRLEFSKKFQKDLLKEINFFKG